MEIGIEMTDGWWVMGMVGWMGGCKRYDGY